MMDWFTVHPWMVGVVTFVLMLIDWWLTILQERERQQHYHEHYASYPVNTIEGNPFLRSAVSERRLINPRHLVAALITSISVTVGLWFIPPLFKVMFVGYIWGLFLIVITTHLGNLLGYRAGRRGLHGKLYLHLRTGHLVQMGRYLALSLFLIILAVCSESLFITGVAIAGITSSTRQLIWLKKIPAIDKADAPPEVDW